MTQASKRTHRLAVAAMLSAVAAVLQFVEFSIPLIPSFVKLDISDLPALLGTFSLGPVYGVVIQLVITCCTCPSAPVPEWVSSATSSWGLCSCCAPAWCTASTRAVRAP